MVAAGSAVGAEVGKHPIRVGETPLVDGGVLGLRQPFVDFLGLRLQGRGARAPQPGPG